MSEKNLKRSNSYCFGSHLQEDSGSIKKSKSLSNFEKLKATIEKQLKPENQSKKQNLFIVKESETEQIDSEIEQNKN